MSAQDRTEQVLREIYILLSSSQVYDSKAGQIIVDKKQILELLKRLTASVYDIMDEYELTKQGRDKAEREARKAGEDIVLDATRKAEDVYASSILYTDEALRRVQHIMKTAEESVRKVFGELDAGMKNEQQIVRRDQSELQSLLHDLHDTDKYMNLIEERNKEIAKEEAKGKEAEKPKAAPYAAAKPEIKVNEEYFEKMGIPLEEPEQEPEEKKSEPPKVNVNLDAEYFKWKEAAPTEEPEVSEEPKPAKPSLFGKKHK